MDTVKLCFAFLGVALIVFIVRGLGERLAFLITLAASVVFFGCVIEIFTPIYNDLVDLSKIAVQSSYVSVMLKALGVAGVTRFASEICRDCGESGIASKIEVLGKLGIISLSLPLLRTVIDIINRLV